MSRRGWTLFAALGLMWGVPYLCIRVAVQELSPASVVFWRCLIGIAVMLPVVAAKGRLRGLTRYWRPILAFSAVEIAVPWLMLTSAEQRLTSSLAGLLIAGVPLVGAVLDFLIKGERLGMRRLSGLIVGVGGVAAIVGLDLGADDTVALAQMGVVVVCYAAGPFILDRYLAGVPGPAVMAVSLTLATIVYTPVGLAQLPAVVPSPQVIVAMAVLGLVCTALALVAFNALIDEVGPARATVVTFVNPAVAVALGVLLLSEPLTAGLGVGFVLVLIGSVLATHRQPVAAAQPEPATVG